MNRVRYIIEFQLKMLKPGFFTTEPHSNTFQNDHILYTLLLVKVKKQQYN